MDRLGHAPAKNINTGDLRHKRRDQSCFSVTQQLFRKVMNGLCAPLITIASREMCDMPFALCTLIGNARKASIWVNAVACAPLGYFLGTSDAGTKKIIGDPLSQRKQMEEHQCLSLPT